MALRTGLRSIRDLAFQLCKFVTVFTPIIKRVFPNETALHTALEVAAAACAVLVTEADAVLEVGD